MKTAIVLAMLLVGATVAVMPTASAIVCPTPTTFDKVQECVQAVEETGQNAVILVLETACDFFGC